MLLTKHQTKREAWLPPVCGAGDESRTRDLNLGKVALYQLSYSRMNLRFAASQRPADCLMQNAASKSGAGDESRTRDLNLGKVALYQLSYSRVLLLLLPSVSRCLVARAPEKRDYVEAAESCQLFLYERLKILLTHRADTATATTASRHATALADLRPRELHVVQHRPDREERGEIDEPQTPHARVDRQHAER
jgi:hypothetical protein